MQVEEVEFITDFQYLLLSDADMWQHPLPAGIDDVCTDVLEHAEGRDVRSTAYEDRNDVSVRVRYLKLCGLK